MIVDAVIKNGKVVYPWGTYSVGIAIDGGKIVSIASEAHLPKADKVIDAKGRYVLPGLIDPHQHWGHHATLATSVADFEEDCRTETLAAANGGVTTVMVFIQFKGSYKEIFTDRKEAVERNAIVDTAFHFSPVTERHVEEIPYYATKFGVSSFKFQLGYRSPEFERRGVLGADYGILYLALPKIKDLGYPATAMIHPENIEIVNILKDKFINRTDLAAWTDSRPSICELESIVDTLFLLEEFNVRTYYVHNSLGEGVHVINEKRKEGLSVFAETCPHYLTLTKFDEKLGPLAKVNPPLRTKENIEKLWQQIKDGVIDCLGTDHVATLKDQKIKPGLWASVLGFPGVETLLPVMLSEGVIKRAVPIERVVEVCAYNVAKIFGLFPKKGTILIGSDADLTIVDLDKRVKVSLAILKGASDFSLYEGQELRGWPVLTMIRGNIIMEDGEIIGKSGIGQYLPRECKV